MSLTVIIPSFFMCPWCEKVKNLLRMHGIAFEERKLDEAALKAFLQPYGVRTVPQVFVGDPSSPDSERIGGYEDTLARVNAGYFL